jgi:Arc/MetJ-type ribon-helix-helix transcriptional regulator
MPKKNDPLKRRSVMLPESFDVDMEKLRAKIGASSDSEVIRRAFRLLKKIAAGDEPLYMKDQKTGKMIKVELAP